MSSDSTKTSRFIFLLQIGSIGAIWIFVLAVTWWIIGLLTLSLKLHDAPDASVGISILVIPIFFILASVLTYVFVGLQLNKTEDEPTEHPGGE